MDSAIYDWTYSHTIVIIIMQFRFTPIRSSISIRFAIIWQSTSKLFELRSAMCYCGNVSNWMLYNQNLHSICIYCEFITPHGLRGIHWFLILDSYVRIHTFGVYVHLLCDAVRCTYLNCHKNQFSIDRFDNLLIIIAIIRITSSAAYNALHSNHMYIDRAKKNRFISLHSIP